MPDSRAGRGLMLLAAVLLALPAGCASTGAPDNWLQPADRAATDPYGAWIRIRPRGDHPDLSGEFLAVDADSVYVLGPGGMRGIARQDVRSARLAYFDPQTGRPGSWVGLMTVSTVSHGFGLIISAPVWILFGSLATGAHSRSPMKDYPHRDWESLLIYARYPQGMPAGLRGTDLPGKMSLKPMPRAGRDRDPEPITP